MESCSNNRITILIIQLNYINISLLNIANIENQKRLFKENEIVYIHKIKNIDDNFVTTNLKGVRRVIYKIPLNKFNIKIKTRAKSLMNQVFDNKRM